ncbi:MAG TPA: hypothetical protein VFB23_04290 [Candidatus Acidoferrales bacterium]|jgi:hypothetical protein|nr:hypothetical protein [Candidatus Acidoferrales bacterium]
MRRNLLCAGVAVMTLAVVLLLVHLRLFGQADNPADAIFGTWKMDQAKSFSHRTDEAPTFATQHTRILAQEGDDGVRNTLINSPTSAPAYSYSAKLDGKEYPDPRGRAGQTLTHWRLGPDLIVRLQKKNGKPSEWAIYTVSSDGRVFTSMSWLPANPELQDFQVFTRAK